MASHRVQDRVVHVRPEHADERLHFVRRQTLEAARAADDAGHASSGEGGEQIHLIMGALEKLGVRVRGPIWDQLKLADRALRKRSRDAA